MKETPIILSGGTRQSSVRRKKVRADTRTWEQRQSRTKVSDMASLKIQDEASLLLTLGSRKPLIVKGMTG